MAAYTLHLDADARPGDPMALARAVVLRDGFSSGAAIFQFGWFLVHGLWLAALAVAVVIVALIAALILLKVTIGGSLLALVALVLLIGHEANAVRAWTLTRRGRPAVDAVIADSRDLAEARLFARWLERSPGIAKTAAAPAAMRTAQMPVVGLFPEAEARR
jgi:hypothetical protein